MFNLTINCVSTVGHICKITWLEKSKQLSQTER